MKTQVVRVSSEPDVNEFVRQMAKMMGQELERKEVTAMWYDGQVISAWNEAGEPVSLWYAYVHTVGVN